MKSRTIRTEQITRHRIRQVIAKTAQTAQIMHRRITSTKTRKISSDFPAFAGYIVKKGLTVLNRNFNISI